MVAQALATQYPAEAKRITAYNDAAWARWTYEVLRHGVEHHSGAGFIAWPDTGRAWSDHLTAEQVTFLNQFLPPVEPNESVVKNCNISVGIRTLA
jgi:hypothetical protein